MQIKIVSGRDKQKRSDPAKAELSTMLTSARMLYPANINIEKLTAKAAERFCTLLGRYYNNSCLEIDPELTENEINKNRKIAVTIVSSPTLRSDVVTFSLTGKRF